MSEIITTAELYAFMRNRKEAVVATNSLSGPPEAALVYIAVTTDLDVIFHALQFTRKVKNLRRDPRIAIVIGWNCMQTVQYEGTAREAEGSSRQDVERLYLEICPEAAKRVNWPDIVFFRVRPKWIRFSDYGQPWRVDELTFP